MIQVRVRMSVPLAYYYCYILVQQVLLELLVLLLVRCGTVNRQLQVEVGNTAVIGRRPSHPAVATFRHVSNPTTI